VLEAYLANSNDPSRTCSRVLERWRELIEHQVAPHPGIERLIGVYGELWHLRELARRSPSAVTAWTGPLGTRHDFMGPGGALEVKASQARRGRFVEIHGAEQLEAPSGGDLFLASMKVELLVVNSGERLIDVVNDLVELAIDRRLLLERLLQIGIRAGDLERA